VRENLDIDILPSELKPYAQLARLLKKTGKLYENELCTLFDREIDVFRKQLKTEIENNWIVKESAAEMKIVLVAKEIV
tara:strand:+ start:77 stop:310 length:234 start_codon:yes stop_codon:yes gene_type:complete